LKDLLVIVNPAAGRGRAAREWPSIHSSLLEKNPEIEARMTARPLEGMDIAEREANNYRCVVAAGGDGTVHEVVNGLMRAGSGAAFGLIPLGSGDDFAKMLVPGQAVEMNFLKAGTRRFDIGRISDGRSIRYFANGMDIGFGAHGARNVGRVPKFLTGFAAYLGALALTLIRYPLLEVRLTIEGEPPRALATAMSAAMNGTTFGGSFRVCPQADPCDGLLDLLLVGPVGRLEILGLVPKILQGSHAGDPRLELRRARRLTIESERPLLVEADGEIAFEAAQRLEVELLPGALRVLG
jgi:diacylglycerol kinase (ATP)